VRRGGGMLYTLIQRMIRFFIYRSAYKIMRKEAQIHQIKRDSP
jgi:hypothetical protein